MLPPPPPPSFLACIYFVLYWFTCFVNVLVLPQISEEQSPEIVPKITANKPPGPKSLYISFKLVPEQGDIDM